MLRCEEFFLKVARVNSLQEVLLRSAGHDDCFVRSDAGVEVGRGAELAAPGGQVARPEPLPASGRAARCRLPNKAYAYERLEYAICKRRALRRLSTRTL